MSEVQIRFSSIQWGVGESTVALCIEIVYSRVNNTRSVEEEDEVVVSLFGVLIVISDEIDIWK